MKSLLVSAALLASSLAFAADDAPVKPDAKDSMKARMLEDAKKKAADAATKAPAAAPAAAKTVKNPLLADPSAAPAPAEPADKPAEKSPAAKAANAQAATQPASVLPKVEVTKTRITVLDVQLAEQQKDIAREEKLTKPTDLDKALNGSKISKTLSALGGQSADYRAGNAAERVRIMKEESDLLEAIAHTKDKKEKEELQKELEELRTYRRELEKNQR